ncbi:hypothetical protein Tco_0903336 [Tanacetum coccineum]
MIGFKVMRTLASVEIEIMLILGFPCCLRSSSVRFLKNVGCLPQCLLTQRFPPRLTELRTPECPYHFLRIPMRLLGRLIWMRRTLSLRILRDPVETETHEPPLTVAPPTSLPESASSTLVPILRKTARMVMHVPPVMSPGLSASMAEVAAMSDSAFLKDGEDEDDDDEEIEESLDSESMSEDAEDEGPTAEDEDPTAWDESLAAGDEGPGMGVGSHGLDDESRGFDNEGHRIVSDGLGLGEEEEAIPESQQWTVPVVGTAVSVPLGLGYGALKRRKLVLEKDHTDPEDGIVYIDVPAYPPPVLPAQTPPSPEWSSGSLPISPSHSIIPSTISSPMIPLTIPLPVPTPAMAETKGF